MPYLFPDDIADPSTDVDNDVDHVFEVLLQDVCISHDELVEAVSTDDIQVQVKRYIQNGLPSRSKTLLPHS